MKKGFTLIELLAVIVILAIIALIAVPIVLNIIDESKENASLRSADFYLDAVELSVAGATLKNKNITDGDYNILPTGNVCLEYTGTNCTNELVVEVNGEVPDSGTITITGGAVSAIELVYGEKTIVQNDKGKLVYQETPTGPTLSSLCEFKEGTEKTIGAKYECDFGDGKRNFYILELGSNKVQGSTLKNDEVALILEGNYDTTTQAWCASGSDNSCNADGLTTKLDEIAGVWTKLERKQIGLPSVLQVATVDGQTYTDYTAITYTNKWLYNWPNNADYALGETAPYGYWTSSPGTVSSDVAWRVNYFGSIFDYSVDDGSACGVRPVVNLKI